MARQPHAFLLVLALGAAPFAVFAQDTGSGRLRISFVDVGQGDAIWIHGPDEEDGTPGGNLIIDGGPERKEKNRLLRYLQDQDYGLKPGNEIDCIVSTHPHNDHYPGLLDVMETFEVRTIVDTGFPKSLVTPSGNPSEFQKFRLAALAEKVGGVKSTFLELAKTTPPRSQLVCGNITVSILHAHKTGAKFGSKANTQENNASIVLKLDFGGFQFLFMGDAEGQERHAGGKTAGFVEKELLAKITASLNPVKATVLKAGHHGSDTGTTTPFIEAVKPEVVVISSGRKDFGKLGAPVFLPDKVTLDRIAAANKATTVVRTDDSDAAEGLTDATAADGDDIYMITDGETLRVYRAVRKAGTNERRWRLVRNIKGGSN